MACFLFVDESGGDKRDSPCEVLAGVSVEDRDAWNLIEAIKDAEERIFGVRYSRQKGEIKGKKFLKKKVFRHAAQRDPISPDERRRLARECIEFGDTVNKEQITALAQAKLAYVGEVFDLCASFHCHAFASIVEQHAPRPVATVLRKDYAFLFERFFCFLEDRGSLTQGLIVFDELEKTQSHILIGQMEEYFLNTATGRQRSRQIIPEPFFVHSDLTSLIQVADLLAYVILWGLRIQGLFEAPCRTELAALAKQVSGLRYRATREKLGKTDFVIWSFAVIDDLRGWQDRAEAEN